MLTGNVNCNVLHLPRAPPVYCYTAPCSNMLHIRVFTFFPQVRAVAFDVLVSMAETLPPEVTKAFVLPVLRRYMQPFESDATMQHSVAALFGRIAKAIKPCMDPEDATLLQVGTRPLAASRALPTAALPAVHCRA